MSCEQKQLVRPLQLVLLLLSFVYGVDHDSSSMEEEFIEKMEKWEHTYTAEWFADQVDHDYALFQQQPPPPSLQYGRNLQQEQREGVSLVYTVFWALHHSELGACGNEFDPFHKVELECGDVAATAVFYRSNDDTVVNCTPEPKSRRTLHCTNKDPLAMHASITFGCRYDSNERISENPTATIWLHRHFDGSTNNNDIGCGGTNESPVVVAAAAAAQRNSGGGGGGSIIPNRPSGPSVSSYESNLLMIHPNCDHMLSILQQELPNGKELGNDGHNPAMAQRCFCIRQSRCAGSCVIQQDLVGVRSLPSNLECVLYETSAPVTAAPITPSPVAPTTPAPVPTPQRTLPPASVITTKPAQSDAPSALPSQAPNANVGINPGRTMTPFSQAPSMELMEGPFVTRDTATERVAIPYPPEPDAMVNVQRDCPHDDNNLLDWHSSATWADREEPVADGDVILPTNARVVIRQSVEEHLGYIFVPETSELIIAELNEQPLIELHMKGMRVEGKFTIGSDTCRIQYTQIVITLHGMRPSDAVLNVPLPLVKGIEVTGAGGVISMHGKRYYKTWTRLSKTVEPGDTRLLLQDKVNWEPGQEIVLITTAMKDSREFHQNEVFTIQSVYYPPDEHDVETVVLLEGTIQYRHMGVKEYQAEVGLLSRKVVVEGSALDSAPTDPDPLNCVSRTREWYGDRSIPCPNTELTGYGGHIIVHLQGRGYVSGVELRRMGQTNVLARYPMHFHLLGNGCNGCYITDSSIHRSYYRCVSIHGTNNLLVSENVAYNAVGFCYYLEDGVEEDSTISFNLAAHIHMIAGGPTEDPPTAGGNTTPHYKQHEKLTLPADISAAGFYITNVHNNLIGNAASGGWTGFAFPTLPQAIGPHRHMQKRPMNVMSLTIDGNTAHSTAWWWHRSGTFYFGGALFYDSEDPSLLVYNPGRDRTHKRNTCIVDKCVTANDCTKFCPENEKGWIAVTNTKAFLTAGAGLNAWNGRMDILTFETHDMGLSMEGLQDGISIDNMLAVCRSGNELVMPPAATLRDVRGLGFFWYDTNQEHIITNSTFRRCGARHGAYNQYNDDPTRGCGPNECRTDSFVFGFRAHSDQHNPELMQATKNITFDNCGRRFSLHDYRSSAPPTVSGRLQNWVDYDGSVTGMGTKSLIVSGLESCGLWWNADPDAVYDPHGPLYFLDQIGRRGLGHIRLSFDEELHRLVPDTYCDNAKGNPCPPVGYIKHRGLKFKDDQGLPVTANPDIVGLTGGFGWELRLDEGAPRMLRIERVEVMSETPMLLSVGYPLGTTINVTAYADKCRESPDFSCEERFHRVNSLSEVYTSLGNAYHYDEFTGVVTIRIIATARRYVGTPEWILPDLNTPDRGGSTYAIPRFQRFDIVLPKVNKGPRLEIVSDCEPSPSNPAYCADMPPESEPVQLCPSGYQQVGFDRCCSERNENDCLFAYDG